MSDVRPRAVVAGHADYAVGIVSAVEQITGRGAALVPVSGAGRSGAEIEEAIRATLNERGLRVIFTDLQAGSCSMAARRLMRGIEGTVLVCGANLPALLDFVLADDLPPEDAARRAVERGRSAMTLLEATLGTAPGPAPDAAPRGGSAT